MNLKNYEKAEEYFLKSLKFSDSVSLHTYTNMNHHGLGINYSRWGNYKKALHHNKIALDFFRKQGSRLYEFDVLNNTAVVYQRMNKPDSVIFYGKLALKIAKEIKHQLAISGANLTLSNAYLNKEEYNKAEKILLEVAKDTVNPKVIDINSKASIYSNLSEVYEGKFNYLKSLEYHKRFKKLNDSIEKQNLDSKFSDLEIKYQTEKKEKENLQLKADKAEQAELLAKESKRKWQLGAGLITALLTLAIFTFYYRRNKKQKEVIESLQKELHHRIKNNLSIIDSFIEVAKEEFDDQKFSLKLTELQNRIDSINEVHQQLYKNKDVTNLNLKNYIDTLSSNVSNSFSNTKVIIEKEVEDNLNLNADKSFPVGLIINEFLTNSYKYAFGDDGGKVKIKIKKTDSKYNLTLSDNGKGLPKDFNIKTSESFGLRIIKLLAEQLNGSFDLNNTNGVVLNISFPK
jgi:two-component sensor histidine kinase